MEGSKEVELRLLKRGITISPMAAFSPLLAEHDTLKERIREQVAQELDELDGQS